MERGSDKHARRLDEDLKHDTASLVHGSPVEARASEEREQEGPANGEPTPDAMIAGDRTPPGPAALTPDKNEGRVELARPPQPSVSPANRAPLVAGASA